MRSLRYVKLCYFPSLTLLNLFSPYNLETLIPEKNLNCQKSGWHSDAQDKGRDAIRWPLPGSSFLWFPLTFHASRRYFQTAGWWLKKNGRNIPEVKWLLPSPLTARLPFSVACLSLAAKNLLFPSHLPHPIHTEKIMCPASSRTESGMSAHISLWMKITYPCRMVLCYPEMRPYWIGWLILQPSGPGISANGFGVLHKPHAPGFNVASVGESLSCYIILHSYSKAAFWLSDNIWHVSNIDSSGDFQVFYLCQVEREQRFSNKINMYKGNFWLM